MSKKEFFESVKDCVVKVLHDDDPSLEGKVTEMHKINGCNYHGISFSSDKTRISPVLYLDGWWSKYHDKDMDLNDIVECLVRMYREHIGRAHEITVDGLSDDKSIRESVIPALCNVSNISDYLKNCPIQIFCDELVIYYKIRMDIADSEGSVVVNNNLMNSWGISQEELNTQAWVNIYNINPPSVVPIHNILKETISSLSEQDIDIGMYVLCSQNRIGGAVYMTDANYLQTIADDMNMDLIIIPSSRQEAILLDYETAPTPERQTEILQMVTEINHNGTVSQEDFLADSVYSFVRSRGTVEKVA